MKDKTEFPTKDLIDIEFPRKIKAGFGREKKVLRILVRAYCPLNNLDTERYYQRFHDSK